MCKIAVWQLHERRLLSQPWPLWREEGGQVFQQVQMLSMRQLQDQLALFAMSPASLQPWSF
jgi:hypothetical protein